MAATAEEPRETDCTRVGKILDMIVDSEASETDQQFFYKHLEECVPCFETHQKQQLLKGLVQGKVKRKAVPAGLIDSIKAKIRKTV
ncbi:MAG: hypothetical protein LPJ89_07620 [Hymenobacteraceae bacterium]|nr:hypothetical protein [Hymenobacteraceae bacterium]MDX5397222.1 hypothetical protein [Hymenobacteraceae bacterium]MDX5443635.1 hypothetical protein [Hymenobacteraceae bacterium]MDX5513298.1 hypothetical protein [Hymenobacteraceae bacterium]